MVLSNIEEARQTITLDALREAFHDDKITAAEVAALAYSMQANLERYFNIDMNLEPKQLDNDEFDKIYNPAYPTILVDPDHTYSGSELLGLVSHDDGMTANIIYVPTTSSSAAIQENKDTNEAYLRVTSGAIVLPSGQVVCGTFPRPITAQIIETADLSLIEQCENAGIATFHSSEKMRHFNDKSNLDSLSNNAHTYVPTRITADDFANMERTDNLVIKPSKHSQGRGVLLTDADADPEHTKRFHQFLVDNNYEPIIEERARSWEINHPETGERLDWNVRAILSYGELIDMYVRADLWGGPVNMSLTAGAIHMDDFSKYFKNPNDAIQVMQRLCDSAEAIASENPSSLIGVDLTVDEDMNTCLFEINNGHTGGLQTVAMLEGTYDDKLDMSRKVLKKMLGHIPPANTHPEGNETELVPLSPSFNTISQNAYYGKLARKFLKLDIDEIPDNDEDRFGAVLALVAIRTNIHWQIYNPSIIEKAGDRLIEQYPLELHHYLGKIYAESVLPSTLKSFMPYIEEHRDIFGESAANITIKARVAAADFDLAQFKDIYNELKERAQNAVVELYNAYDKDFNYRFSHLSKDLTNEDFVTFYKLVRDTITAYCEYDYDTADAVINRKLVTSGAHNQLSQIINSLRFCVAYANGSYDDAMRYFHECEEDFDDKYDFYATIVDDYIPHGLGELEGCSLEHKLFATRVDMIKNGALVALADTVQYLCTHAETDDETRSRLIEVMVDTTPLDTTTDEHDQLKRVLTYAVNNTRSKLTIQSQTPDFASLSDSAKYTLLIETIFSDDKETAQLLIKELRDVDGVNGSLDYIEDAYVLNAEDWAN